MYESRRAEGLFCDWLRMIKISMGENCVQVEISDVTSTTDYFMTDHPKYT